VPVVGTILQHLLEVRESSGLCGGSEDISFRLSWSRVHQHTGILKTILCIRYYLLGTENQTVTLRSLGVAHYTHPE